MHHQNIQRKNKLDEGQLFKISRFKEVIKTTVPHTHGGYYEFIYIREGEGYHCVEMENYRISAPEFYFLKPGQLHCWQFTAIPKGYVILMKETYFDTLRAGDLTSLFKNAVKTVRVPLPEGYEPSPVFEEIQREHTANTVFSTSIIQGYLQALFSKFLQLSDENLQQPNAPSKLYEQFLNLLRTRCPELHYVHEYATLLHTTPQNLNAACRKYLGKSAGELIAGQLILDAKRYLYHTDKTVAEIALELHFNDPSYFVRFFKKQEGATPGQFRESRFQ